MKGRITWENMRKDLPFPINTSDRVIITSKKSESAGRFGNWDNVEFDKTTGKSKKVSKPEGRPVNKRKKDAIIVSDPDGEGNNDFNKTQHKMFSVPSDDEIRKTRDIIAKDEATSTEEKWERYVAPSHRSTPDTLFSKPPERFIAKLPYGDLVYAWLVEENEDFLCYMCMNNEIWTTVYVYKGLCSHQEHMILSVFGRNDVNWLVVPITARNSKDEFSRSNGLEWSVWIFHHYFGFALFPEPN